MQINRQRLLALLIEDRLKYMGICPDRRQWQQAEMELLEEIEQKFNKIINKAEEIK